MRYFTQKPMLINYIVVQICDKIKIIQNIFLIILYYIFSCYYYHHVLLRHSLTCYYHMLTKCKQHSNQQHPLPFIPHLFLISPAIIPGYHWNPPAHIYPLSLLNLLFFIILMFVHECASVHPPEFTYVGQSTAVGS